MKKFSLALALIVAGVSGAGLALADATQGSGQFQPGPGQGQNLDTIKQRIEQRIQARISKMQEILACVQNAHDRQNLRSCLPRRRSRGRAGFGPGHQGSNG